MTAFTGHPVGFVGSSLAFLGLMVAGHLHVEILCSDLRLLDSVGKCQAHVCIRTQDPSYVCTRRQADACMVLSCIPLRLHCLDWAIHSLQGPSS